MPPNDGGVNMSKRWSLKEIQNYVAANSDSKLLSTEYRGFSQKLQFQCACGETFEKTFTKFKNNKQTKCDTCQPPKQSR